VLDLDIQNLAAVARSFARFVEVVSRNFPARSAAA